MHHPTLALCTMPSQPAAHSQHQRLDFWRPTYSSRLPFRPHKPPPDTTTPNISSPPQDALVRPGSPISTLHKDQSHPRCLLSLSCEVFLFLSALIPPSHPPPQAQNILLTLLPWQGGTGSHTAAGRRGWRRLLLLLLPWGKRTRGRGRGLPTGRRRRRRHHAHRRRGHHTCRWVEKGEALEKEGTLARVCHSPPGLNEARQLPFP